MKRVTLRDSQESGDLDFWTGTNHEKPEKS